MPYVYKLYFYTVCYILHFYTPWNKLYIMLSFIDFTRIIITFFRIDSVKWIIVVFQDIYDRSPLRTIALPAVANNVQCCLHEAFSMRGHSRILVFLYLHWQSFHNWNIWMGPFLKTESCGIVVKKRVYLLDGNKKGPLFQASWGLRDVRVYFGLVCT